MITYTKPQITVLGEASRVIQNDPKDMVNNPEGAFIEVTPSYETEE